MGRVFYSKSRVCKYQFRMEFGQQKHLDNSALATRGGPSVLVESRGLFGMSSRSLGSLNGPIPTSQRRQKLSLEGLPGALARLLVVRVGASAIHLRLVRACTWTLSTSEKLMI